jgi:hypothetical protein
LPAKPLDGVAGQPDLAASDAMSASERLREASSWNRVASQLAIAGEKARSEDRPGQLEARATSGRNEVRAERPLDIGKLFVVLAGHNVDFVVIGGVAARVHGHRRTTMDLDLTPDPDPENLRRLSAALSELDARPVDSGEEMLVTRHGQIHILKEPKGARPFDEMRERALLVDLDGVTVAIVSLDDLIRMKRAAGRPRDLDDIATLAEVERSGRAT